jgi:uncharacterized protein (TIGR02996 family)
MSNATAFIDAIRAAPQDMGLRLIFADWLEERGDPRAQFIRVQCELASLPDDHDRRPQLLAEEQALLAGHEKAWLGKLKPLVKSHRFACGFVDWVSLPGRQFLTTADKLFALAPIRKLRLTHLGLGKFPAEALASMRQLEAIDELELSGLAGDERIAAILRSPALKNVRKLQLDEVRCGRAALAALWQGALPRLEALELIEDIIPDGKELLGRPARSLREYAVKSSGAGILDRDDVIQLAKARSLNSLTLLDLRNNSVQVPGATALANSKVLTKLEVLGLKGCAIGVRGMQALAASANVQALRRLNVRGNNLGVNGLRAIVESTRLQQLRHLDLSNNNLDARCVPHLCQWPGLARLRSLDLDNKPLGDAALAELLAAPALGSLWHLNLRETEMGKLSAQVLLGDGRLDNVLELNLGYNDGLKPFKNKLLARFGSRLRIVFSPY